jgi:hypothetical protein
MRTVNFNDVLNDAIQLCGLDRDEFTVQTFRQLRDFASARLRFAWEYDRFPDLIRYENVSVTNTDNTYYCIKPSSAGEVLNVWDRNPFDGTRAINIPFVIQVTNTQERIVVLKDYDAGLYIEYRIKPVQLKGNPWVNTVAYSAGSQVYFDAGSASGTLQPVEGKPFTANFYECLATNTNQIPSQNPSSWEIVKIPYIFGPYLSRAVFSDYLRSEGQYDSAMQADGEAKYYLDVEIDKIARQQGQMQNYKFIKSY